MKDTMDTIVKPNQPIYQLAKYATFVLVCFAFIATCYFGNILRLNMRFDSQIPKFENIFYLLQKLDQERIMHLIVAYEPQVDINNFKALQEESNELIDKMGLSDEFKQNLNKLRAIDIKTLNSKELLQYFDKFNYLMLRVFTSIRALNVNPEIHAEINTMHMMFLNNIALNRIRDFLFKFSNGLNKMTQEDLELLDEMRFKFVDYVTVLKESNIKISYTGFSYNSKSTLANEIAEIGKKNKSEILQFYNIIREAMTDMQTPVKSTKLISLCQHIENVNIKITNALLNSIKYQQKNGQINLIILIACSLIVLFVFLILFNRVRKDKIELLEALRINSEHIQRIREIAIKRGENPDSKTMQDLFIRAVEFIHMADTIERRYQNEYSHFMTNISHEIISPLNDISGYIKLLNIKECTKQEQQQYLKSINEAALNIKKLFDNLLVISRIQSKNIELYSDKFNLIDIVYNIADNFSQKMKENNIEFLVFIDPNLDGTITADQEKISFVIIKLLESAIKYSIQNGKIMLMIKKVGMDNKNLIISVDVIDNGIGMDDTDVKQNFMDENDIKAKMYIMNNLDLAIVNDYLQLMGTELNVKGELNKGTWCNFELRVEFIEKTGLKNKYQGETLLLCKENISTQKNTFPILGNEQLPNYFDILTYYLAYLGIAYKFSNEKEEGIYFVKGIVEPFVGISKCIFASSEEPNIISDKKVWLKEPFSPYSFVESYEIVSGKKITSISSAKLSANVLALVDNKMVKIISNFVNDLDTQIIPDVQYDLAFIDLDRQVDFEQLPISCHLVAVGNAKNAIDNNKVSFSNFIVKSANLDDENLIKDEISQIISEYRRKTAPMDKKLRDILLFKKSYAANYIYKNTISSFANYVDIANTEQELEEFLQKNPYKIVLCDFDIPNFSLDKYIAIIENARRLHNFNIIAGIFAPKDFKMFAREFEIIHTNLNKNELELQLKKYLGLGHEY